MIPAEIQNQIGNQRYQSISWKCNLKNKNQQANSSDSFFSLGKKSFLFLKNQFAMVCNYVIIFLVDR